MRVQKAKCGVCYFCDALDFHEQWRRAGGLFLERSLTSRAPDGWARTRWSRVGRDEKRINSGSRDRRVCEVGLEELCLDVLHELVKVSDRIESELGQEPV